MSFLLDKMLPLGVYPLGLALVFIGIGIALNFLGRRRASILLLAFATLELWVFSTPLVSRLLLSTLENTSSRSVTGSADVAVLLGGMIRSGQNGPDLTDAADRAVAAFRLFRNRQVKKILVSGGNLPWSTDPVPEAQHIAALLREWGTPNSTIIIEDQSRNTWENAVNSKELWDRHEFTSGFLVTSASHMPRAMATFRRAGLSLTPAATDFRNQPYFEGGLLAVLPSAEALQDSTTAIKEWLGRLVYDDEICDFIFRH
jgi:uncharacterized SAM-binding protein YcdF (DUF218 family)